ncbi:hypothetical protein ASPSYDRAFT_33092 [Aspergillus sydowii CBS 593.65]|uniref:Uncharacterized protein n=1 Tax=Aspergillus sydowii CBS 593.65 TaxID=1036612 RepID=A0A1L9TCD3_9EURO|nr:uncharacterized protein ASPSYDRAFT_33092 [Aspergillus sydowii CBS 593.65]OJJ56943.1 hypothetical protein ASPSYDRAFT_33092 [Aspergillus sydowii CBS 593.65]
MFNVHRIVVALFFILLCTMAADRTDCTKDYFRDPAQSYLIKAGAAWIGHALERNNFVRDSNECKKVWCIDGASIYFCNVSIYQCFDFVFADMKKRKKKKKKERI